MYTISKEQVVELMTNKIDEMNREMATSQGMPLEIVEDVISQSRPELNRVNGMLYDLLVDNGIIK